MMSRLMRFQGLFQARALIRANLTRRCCSNDSSSAKDTFKMMFPLATHSRHPKPKYDTNSYGQSTGADYPFEMEKSAESKVKRDKIKDAFGSVTADEVLNVLKSNGAFDIRAMQLPGDMNYAEHFIIASGKSTDHIKDITETIRNELKAKHGHTVHVEGLETFDWMAVDAGNVVVHLFLPQVREEYHIEETWTN